MGLALQTVVPRTEGSPRRSARVSARSQKRKRKTLAICDSEPATALAICEILSASPDIELCSVVQSLAATKRLLRQASPAVVILDEALGVQTVRDCVSWLRASGRLTAVVVWGAKLAQADAIRFVQAGAMGIVRKTAAPEMLLTCLRSVAAGAFWSEFAVGFPGYPPDHLKRRRRRKGQNKTGA